MESSELLSNFLKIYDLKEYKVIPTGLNVHADPRLVIFDKNNCYYKIFFIKETKYVKKYDYIFFNNAHFPNHLVSSVIEENIWIVKQTIPKGTLLSKFFLKPNTVNENIIDSFLNNLIWVKNETRRIFPEEHKYWDYSAGDSCASNIIYDIETNTSTNIDIEPSAWLTRDEYLEKTYYRLLKHFENFNSYPYCNFLPVLEMPKILDKCMKFIDKEVL